MTKVAIPILNGHTALQFENSNQFLIYDLSNSDTVVLSRHLERSGNNHPELIPQKLAEQNVKIVLARWIHKDIAKMLSDFKISLFTGVSEQEPDELVEDFIEGHLETDDKMCY